MTRLLLASALTASAACAGTFAPVLPTDNDALLRGKPEKFYMYTDRDFEGQKSQPWQGGGYGFTRNPERVGGRVVQTRLHEGIDIQPMRRDAAGEPLDDVRAIESGRVVHVSSNPRESNYGNYVVIEHEVEGAPIYSLYAHLAAAHVAVGQTVARGEKIGRLGYTGAGINRRRAHLHLEIAIMWHDGFESWHAANFPSPNKHSLWNGLNLMGLDAAGFYLARRDDPSLTLPQFLASEEAAFRLRFPASPHFQLPSRYPWLVRGRADDAGSWLVAFTAAGFPVAITPSPETVADVRVEWAQPQKFPYGKVTRSLLDGPPGQPRLGPSGEKLAQLLTWDPAAASSLPASP